MVAAQRAKGEELQILKRAAQRKHGVEVAEYAEVAERREAYDAEDKKPLYEALQRRPLALCEVARRVVDEKHIEERKGEPISHGANPNPGFRRDGAPTAQSNGIAAIQCGYGNTAPLQIEFDPGVNIQNGGVDIITQFVLGHFAAGGTLININILERQKLLEAHENPDLHPDLVVRVTGFTAYFSSLSPEFRQLVVNRFLEGI